MFSTWIQTWASVNIPTSSILISIIHSISQYGTQLCLNCQSHDRTASYKMMYTSKTKMFIQRFVLCLLRCEIAQKLCCRSNGSTSNSSRNHPVGAWVRFCQRESSSCQRSTQQCIFLQSQILINCLEERASILYRIYKSSFWNQCPKFFSNSSPRKV